MKEDDLMDKKVFDFLFLEIINNKDSIIFEHSDGIDFSKNVSSQFVSYSYSNGNTKDIKALCDNEGKIFYTLEFFVKKTSSILTIIKKDDNYECNIIKDGTPVDPSDDNIKEVISKFYFFDIFSFFQS